MPPEHPDFNARRPPDEPAMPPELLGPDASPEELRPVYERLAADARAWSATVAPEAPLADYIRSLPRRFPEEAAAMETRPDDPGRDARSRPPAPGRTAAPRGGFPRGRTLPAIAAAVLIVALLGGALYALGLGRGAGTAPGGAPTASPQPTATTAPQTTATADPATAACSGPPSGQPAYHTGDVIFSQPSIALGYPYYKLPAGVALKPQQVAGASPPNPLLTNPGMAYGLIVYMCNTSKTQSHIITSAKLRVDTFSSFSGQVDEWNLCDGPYNTATKQTSGGCGGGFQPGVMLTTTLPANVAAGTTVGAVPAGDPKLPVSLPGGVGMALNIAVADPIPPGTYTFSLGLSVDGAAPVFAPNAEKPILFAPVAHKWSGQACETPSMLAQIPSSADATYYVCPES